MKTTLQVLHKSMTALTALRSARFQNPEVAIRFREFMRAANLAYQDFADEQKQLAESHGGQRHNNLWLIPADKQPTFNEAAAKLLAVEVDLPIFKIRPADVPGGVLTDYDLEALEWLIIIEAKPETRKPMAKAASE